MRKAPEYDFWRNGVFYRDNFTCRVCGSKGNVHAHHIIGVAKDVDYIYDINNGITLCETCHGKIHNIDYSKRYPKFVCEFCGGEFRSDRERRFCSKRCHYSWRSTQPSPKKGKKYPHLVKRLVKQCVVCGKDFMDSYHKNRDQKYCSMGCYLFDRWKYTGKKAEKI